MKNAQAGWYPDPSGNAAKLRYWDGTQWTDTYCDATPGTTPGATPLQTPAYTAPTYAQPANGQAYYPQVVNDSDRTLRLVAFILCIISTVAACWLIIPLAWMIPMSVRSWGIYQGTKPNTTAFGVCTLIFVNIISGILLLVSKKDA